MMAANQNEPGTGEGRREKISTGPNDRPLDESIGQTAGGLPDDSSAAVEVDEATVKRVEKALKER
ncbi:hypothetical protein [Antarcticirhabdus aurantiaca]|uniref:Uncharacterized protein n=1 Tax=Antarcticirhabdus aurantiaca TaxID=2606717 RepID=A0ACD4NLM2_9HYPH|nr:hypothetical protein [Antarcticirhabdus aurantiaca]WAJ27677.1 hypothetical protein OXU80_23005 [Jeongeuplla avenae]